MFKKKFQLVFIFCLILGTTIAVTSSSWVISWLGLELNLMSMIPLILFKLNFNSTESAIKYFIPQAFASVIFIASASIQLWALSYLSTLYMNLTFTMALALKSGMAPLHFWFPQIMLFSEWNVCAIFLVWQKIAPFILLSSISFNEMIFLLIITSSLVGALGGLNLLSTKLILTYSSIIHSSWMLSSLLWSVNLWSIYFLIYSMISLTVIHTLNNFNIESVTQLSKNKLNSPEKMTIIFNIMSLAGLPPFLGFSAKLLVLFKMMKILGTGILVIMVMSSLTSLFYYLKLFFNLLMNNKTKEMFNPQMNISTQYNSIFFSVLMNLFIPCILIMT